MIYDLKVDNIKCSGCVQAIKTGLIDIVGVTDVKVDIQNGTVRIEASQNCSLEAILEKLKSLGYPGRTKGSSVATVI